jgi:hypothetical protein
VEGVVYRWSWDKRIAMIRKAIHKGIPLNRIEQALDWLDYLLSPRELPAFPGPRQIMGKAR